MTANVNVTKVLFKRGNTVQNAAYTGINGEITVDTQAKTLRIHDGVTTGGNVIVAGGVVGSYSNTNAAAYIPTDSTITAIQSNVTAANAAITVLQSNASTQQTQINLLNANVTAANTLIPNLLAISSNIIPSANVTYSLGSSTRQWKDLWVSNNTIYIGNVPITVSNGNLLVNGNLVTGSGGSGTDDVLRANVGAYQIFANANAATQATSINTFNANLGAYQTFANANAATQATSINTFNANLGAYQTFANANAATQSTAIATLQTQVYANANVAEYLPTYSGNVRAEYLIMSFGGIITTGASPAPSISGFSSISTAGNAVNEGNISASGNLVANRGAYITGNVTAGNVSASQYNFANGVNILSTVGTYSNTNVASYLPTYSGNVRALNFVGAVQAQVGSSFAYAQNAFGSGSDTGGVFLPADVNSNAIVAGYTIVSNAGVTLTVTSASFVAGTPIFVSVSTTPTASSFVYPVTVYSADYSPALPLSTITVGNATISGNVTAPRYLFANGVNILSTVAGTYGNTQVASYLLNFDGDIEFTSSTAKIGNVDVITVMDSIRSPAYQFSNGTSIFDGITGTYSNTNVAAYLTLGVTTANLTATGNITQQSAYYETYGNISNTGGNLTCNFNLGTVFYAALTANVTANFTNVNAIASTVTGATIIVDQGATAYRVANVQVNGVNQTIRWVGATVGTGTASNTDVMSFGLIHLGGGAYRVLGQISNYG